MLGEHLVFMQQNPSSIPSRKFAKPKSSSSLIHTSCPLEKILESIVHITEREDEKHLKDFLIFLINNNKF